MPLMRIPRDAVLDAAFFDAPDRFERTFYRARMADAWPEAEPLPAGVVDALVGDVPTEL